MSGFPKVFNVLVESLSRFPGVGRRSAERMALHVLEMPSHDTDQLCRSIRQARQQIKPCQLCNNFTTSEVCAICADPKRDKETVCVVEEPKDILAIEKTSQYRGLYYVLLGSLSPLEGVNIQDLNLGKLISRLQQGQIKEVIISTDPDNDGELTAQFLIEQISPYKVKIYRLAIGIPLGTQIEYIDPATLTKALLEKKPIV